jgi:hypothetical protein
MFREILRYRGLAGGTTQQSVRNGQEEILREVSNLERTGVEGYREVSVYTGVYQEGRGPEAISQE